MKLPVPTKGADLSVWGRDLTNKLDQQFAALETKSGSVTLRASQTTTTISDAAIYAGSVILLMPTTANAAGATANVYVSARAAGSATLTHSSAVSTDRTFVYVVL